MRYLKYSVVFIFLVACVQISNGQAVIATDENGRSLETIQPAVKEAIPDATVSKDVFNGSDQDIPGKHNQRLATDISDYEFPMDMDIIRAEMDAGTASPELMAKLNAIVEQLHDLQQSNEELRTENRLIRKSMRTCCSSKNMGLSATDAYLTQNAPNPFNGASVIKYFVPEGLGNVKLEIRDLKGSLIKSYPVEGEGWGSIDVKAEVLVNSTYIYTLIVDEEIIDSKVMILNK